MAEDKYTLVQASSLATKNMRCARQGVQVVRKEELESFSCSQYNREGTIAQDTTELQREQSGEEYRILAKNLSMISKSIAIPCCLVASYGNTRENLQYAELLLVAFKKISK